MRRGDVMVKAAIKDVMFMREERMTWRNVWKEEILRYGWELCVNVMRVCRCEGGIMTIYRRRL